MSAAAWRRISFLLLAAALVLRHDLWWWNDATPLFGLPIGLTYHILFCLAASGIMALLVRFAWPKTVTEQSDTR